ncbi:MAG: hypothetical protein ACOX52_06480 [Verrucomicrobiota bacterium]|jgi:hypothetical protein|nr:hypothetical protein [Verrucomicrobiota bacterium]
MSHDPETAARVRGRSGRCDGWSLIEVFFALMMGGIVLTALAHTHFVATRMSREAAIKDRALGCAERVLADCLIHRSWPTPGEETPWLEDADTGLMVRVRSTVPELAVPGLVVVDVEVARPGRTGEVLVVLSSAGIAEGG